MQISLSKLTRNPQSAIRNDGPRPLAPLVLIGFSLVVALLSGHRLAAAASDTIVVSLPTPVSKTLPMVVRSDSTSVQLIRRGIPLGS